MTRAFLIEASPRDPATKQVVPVYLAGGGRKGYTHRGRTDWRAGVVGLPAFSASLGFGQGGWTGSTSPQQGVLRFAPAGLDRMEDLGRLLWNGARVDIYVGDDEPDVPQFDVFQRARVARVAIGADNVLSLTLADLSEDLSLPLAIGTFAGTGGIEGDAAARNRVKRRSFGRVFNVEGRTLLAAQNIAEFGDPSRPLQGFVTIKDKGRPYDAPTVVTWKGSIAATLNALIAAAPAQGSVAVAPSIACVKTYTTPAGPLTADLLGEVGAGYIETVAAIAERVALDRTTIAVENVAAAVALRPGPAGLHMDDASESAAMALDRLLLGASLLWTAQPAGTIRLRSWQVGVTRPATAWTKTGSGAIAWNATGSGSLAWQPDGGGAQLVQSRQMSRVASFAPLRNRRVGYQRNHRVQSLAEISTVFAVANVSLSRAAVNLSADASGAVSDYSPATGQVRVTSTEGLDLTSSSTFLVTQAGQVNVVGSVDATGAYKVTNLTADQGSLTIVATYNGQNYPVIFSISKTRAGQNGQPGQSGSSYIAPPTLGDPYNAGNGVRIPFTTSGSMNNAKTRLYRRQDSSDFNGATQIAEIAGGVAVQQDFLDSNVGPTPTYYYWAVAIATDGSPSAIAGPKSFKF